VTMAEEKKKLSYFLQDKFFIVEDAYNDAPSSPCRAADHLQEAISNFVKVESSACDSGTVSTFRDKMKSSSLKLPRIALPKFSGKFFE